MAVHDVQIHTVIAHGESISEKHFAAARTALDTKIGVEPVEVFLDSIQTDGIFTNGDIVLDLDELALIVLAFGADEPAVTEPTAAPTVVPDSAPVAVAVPEPTAEPADPSPTIVEPDTATSVLPAVA